MVLLYHHTIKPVLLFGFRLYGVVGWQPGWLYCAAVFFGHLVVVVEALLDHIILYVHIVGMRCGVCNVASILPPRVERHTHMRWTWKNLLHFHSANSERYFALGLFYSRVLTWHVVLECSARWLCFEREEVCDGVQFCTWLRVCMVQNSNVTQPDGVFTSFAGNYFCFRYYIILICMSCYIAIFDACALK